MTIFISQRQYDIIVDSYPKKYLEILRAVSGEKRLTIAFDLYDMAIDICRAAILESNPNIDSRGLKLELWRRLGYDPARHTYQGHRKDR